MRAFWLCPIVLKKEERGPPTLVDYMAGASARCGAEDAGIATLEVDSGRSCSRRRTSSPAIFEVQGDRFRSYSMFQNLNSAKAYSKSFLKMVSNTVRVLWLLRESVLTSVQRPANPAVVLTSNQQSFKSIDRNTNESKLINMNQH